MKNTSERLIKSIVDLRKKIYIVQEKLDNEIKVRMALNGFHFNLRNRLCLTSFQRKKDMEKKLSELRKDISRQKKSLTVRRNTQNHTPLATSTTGTTSLTSHCPIMSQSGAGHSCSSLPPIKKAMLAK